MCDNNRNLMIKNFNLCNNMNKFIFAKTLFKSISLFDENLILALSNVILNRFLYEYNIDSEINFIKCITNTSFFPCWKNLKEMDEIDISNSNFKLCLDFADKALKGKLDDNTFSSFNFHKKSFYPTWSIGLKSVAIIDDYLFYNNCD